jgi:hypothetical protein
MAFHPPTPTVEQMYMHSFNETLEHYRGMLIAQQEGRLELPNENLDTGELTEPTVYPFSDEAYAKLLAKVNGEPVSDALRTDILVYYVDLGAPFATKKDPKAWQNVLDELTKLKGLPATGASQ